MKKGAYFDSLHLHSIHRLVIHRGKEMGLYVNRSG